MVGSTISHYKILEKLGEGGMGVVYKAEDTKLKRIVALKFLPSRLISSDEDIVRFQREAEAISALNHPHIATIHDVDELDGQKFLVLEYLSGGTLDRLGIGGVMLGIMSDFPYEEETIELQPGSLFIAYSDGITEAMKSHDEEFGEERLAEILIQHRDAPAKKIIDIVLDELKNYTNSAPLSDDRTMIVIKRL